MPNETTNPPDPTAAGNATENPAEANGTAQTAAAADITAEADHPAGDATDAGRVVEASHAARDPAEAGSAARAGHAAGTDRPADPNRSAASPTDGATGTATTADTRAPTGTDGAAEADRAAENAASRAAQNTGANTTKASTSGMGNAASSATDSEARASRATENAASRAAQNTGANAAKASAGGAGNAADSAGGASRAAGRAVGNTAKASASGVRNAADSAAGNAVSRAARNTGANAAKAGASGVGNAAGGGADSEADVGRAADSAAGASARVAALVPLRRNRDFTLLWTGQAVSDLGSQMSVISYPLLILAVTGSAARAGLVGSATMVGTLVTLLPAGVVADRYSRRRILVIGSLTQLVTVGSVVPAVLTHHVYLAHLLAVGLLQGSAAAFYIGASQGAVRRIVSPDQLPEAMALTQARGQAAGMVGPPVGGVLFSLARALPFAFDSISFGAITLGAALLRDPLNPVARDRSREPTRTAVTRGLRHLLAQPFLRMAAIWAAAVNAIAAGMLLMVIVIARERGADAIVIGVMVAANAACGLAGSLFGTRLARRFGVRLWVLATSWLLPCCAVGIAFAPWVWLITMLGAVTTFTVMPAGVFFIAHAARITPDDLQAQTANARQLLGSSLSWLAPPLFGGLTDGIGARDAILVAAALYLATACWLQGRPELGELDSLPAHR